jgi:hypothetical protein
LETVWYDSAICRQGKKCKKHGGFPTEVSDMARNMKIELLTFSPILYQSKNCGHRIHVLFMMYDVYWYCQMKKNEWLWKFWKRNDYENFEKRGIVEKRGKEETKSMRLCEIHFVSKYFVHIQRINKDMHKSTKWHLRNTFFHS